MEANDQPQPRAKPADAPALDPHICVFCGAPATTRDHVPPRNIFPEPRPSNLIKVPSCSRCNNGRSLIDEKFRNIVTMRGAIGFSMVPRRPSKAARQLLDGKVTRAFGRRPAELCRLLRTAHEVPMISPGGIYLGRATALQLDSDAHDEMIKRIVQGLYAHHYAVRLRADVPIGNMIVDIDKPGLRAWLDSIVPTLHGAASIGGETFEYAFGRSDSQSSFWLLNFYRRHIVAAYSGERLHALLRSAE
jgi:hypothetical protein